MKNQIESLIKLWESDVVELKSQVSGFKESSPYLSLKYDIERRFLETKIQELREAVEKCGNKQTP